MYGCMAARVFIPACCRHRSLCARALAESVLVITKSTHVSDWQLLPTVLWHLTLACLSTCLHHNHWSMIQLPVLLLFLQLMMYDDNRYEVECKYTQFINLASRPTWPRLDLAPLAAVLNKFEAKFGAATAAGAAGQSDIDAAGDTRDADCRSGSSVGLRWVADNFTDTGELCVLLLDLNCQLSYLLAVSLAAQRLQELMNVR